MEWITAVVALYGAILSTISIIETRKVKQRKVVVKFSSGFVCGLVDPGPFRIFLTASNPGYRSVTLTQPGIILPDGKTIVFLDLQSNVNFPHELLEGKSCTVWVDANEIAQRLRANGFKGEVKLVAFFRDALDTKYISKLMKFNIDEEY